MVAPQCNAHDDNAFVEELAPTFLKVETSDSLLLFLLHEAENLGSDNIVHCVMLMD